MHLEHYILMHLEDEGTVSMHKEEELSGQDLGSKDVKVGDATSCVFKKKLYDGKIAGIGKGVGFVRNISPTFQ